MKQRFLWACFVQSTKHVARHDQRYRCNAFLLRASIKLCATGIQLNRKFHSCDGDREPHPSEEIPLSALSHLHCIHLQLFLCHNILRVWLNPALVAPSFWNASAHSAAAVIDSFPDPILSANFRIPWDCISSTCLGSESQFESNPNKPKHVKISNWNKKQQKTFSSYLQHGAFSYGICLWSAPNLWRLTCASGNT